MSTRGPWRRQRRRHFDRHGCIMKDVSEVAERLWQWLNAGNLEKSIEGYVFAAQEQALPQLGFLRP